MRIVTYAATVAGCVAAKRPYRRLKQLKEQTVVDSLLLILLKGKIYSLSVKFDLVVLLLWIIIIDM